MASNHEARNRTIDEQALKDASGETAEKARQRALKKLYMEPDLSFEDMFKQSCARVYFMKTNRNWYRPDESQWHSPPVADKHLSRFKYNRKINSEKEAFFTAAAKTGREEDANKYKAEADKYLTKCLHAHYVIGVLYTEFLQGKRPVL